jgi:hypothetical protein
MKRLIKKTSLFVLNNGKIISISSIRLKNKKFYKIIK